MTLSPNHLMWARRWISASLSTTDAETTSWTYAALLSIRSAAWAMSCDEALTIASGVVCPRPAVSSAVSCNSYAPHRGKMTRLVLVDLPDKPHVSQDLSIWGHMLWVWIEGQAPQTQDKCDKVHHNHATSRLIDEGGSCLLTDHVQQREHGRCLTH